VYDCAELEQIRHITSNPEGSRKALSTTKLRSPSNPRMIRQKMHGVMSSVAQMNEVRFDIGLDFDFARSVSYA